MARVMAVMVAIVTLGLVTEVLFFQRLDARVREVWGTDRSLMRHTPCSILPS